MGKESIVSDLLAIKKDLEKNENELIELENLEKETETLLENSSLEVSDEFSKLKKDSKDLREKIQNLIEDASEE